MEYTTFRSMHDPAPKNVQGIASKWGFPKIRGTFLGFPIIRTIVFWGLYWGPLILGNYQIGKAIALHVEVFKGARSRGSKAKCPTTQLVTCDVACPG